MVKSHISKNESDTRQTARELAKEFTGGEVITLYGELGAGKTVFAKGIAEGLCISDTVTSPTFTILHMYEGRLKLYHFDMYRITDVSELPEIGYYEAVSDSGGVCVIEWAENIKDELPQNLIKVSIEKIDGNKRKITVEK